MTRYSVYDGETLLADLDDEQSNCRATDHGSLCGGCDSCLVRQAEHRGFRIVRHEQAEPAGGGE